MTNDQVIHIHTLDKNNHCGKNGEGKNPLLLLKIWDSKKICVNCKKSYNEYINMVSKNAKTLRFF